MFECQSIPCALGGLKLILTSEIGFSSQVTGLNESASLHTNKFLFQQGKAWGFIWLSTLHGNGVMVMFGEVSGTASPFAKALFSIPEE